MSRIGRARIATLLLAVLGCRDVAAPVVLPPNTRPLAPRPTQYATWWRMTEACSGLQGNLDAITWYLVRSQEIDIGGEAYDGYWYEDGNRILLSKPSVRDGGTVRHEMLHALLQSGAHPVEYFVTRCGALAPCGTACDLSESNRGVPATAREIPSESLSVSVSLSPIGAPAISVDSGWVTMMVTATNTRAEPVWVTIPHHEGFGVIFRREPRTVDWRDEPRWAFRAGESRSLAFDDQLPAGFRDTLWAFFGNANSSPHAIVVGP